MGEEADPQLRGALARVSVDPSARADVIGLLRGAQVLAACWPQDPALLRTLTNSEGLTALAIFSARAELEEAARRYGWLAPDGRVPERRLHISEALGFGRERGVSLVILDIASEHALELDEGEVELLLSSPSRPPSRQSLRPVHQSSRPPPMSAFRPREVAASAPGATVQATFGAQTNVALSALAEAPAESLTDGLAATLRPYPEVEWACLLRLARGPAPAAPTVAVKVVPEFRENLAEIVAKLRADAEQLGATLDVLVLDDPGLIQQARALGAHFYPWRAPP